MNDITKKIKRNFTREDFNSNISKLRRDVDYYMERGMEEKEALRYVKWWYGRDKK